MLVLAGTGRNKNQAGETRIGGGKMKSRVRSYRRWTTVFLCLVALFVAAGPSWAQFVPYVFQSGTTIKAQEVNDNFSYLGTSLTRIQWAPNGGTVTLNTNWQNLGTITVTPQAAGNLMLIGRASVEISYDQDSAIAPLAHVCISDTSNGAGGGDCGEVFFVGPPQGFAGSRLIVPVTLISPTPDLVAQEPVTYYLTAKVDSSVSEITVTATGGLLAFFAAGILH
jgi:hypothetical protein